MISTMKSPKRINLWAAAVLAAGLWQNTNVLAADSAAEARPARARLIARVRQQLDLTDEQTAKIKEVIAGDRENLKRLVTAVHDARVAVREAINAPGATETSVRAAAQKLSSAEADFAVERLQLRGKINPILTDEQRAKVKELHARIDKWVENAIDRFGQPQP